jgi:mannose-6-phosphate isomerase-like protein (cupin superfamily)
MIITKLSDYPPHISNPSGEHVQELLGIQAGGFKGHSLAEIVIPPGKGSTPHYHRKSEESYLILSGRAEMHINTTQIKLRAGEAVLIEPMEVHQIQNVGEEDLVFLAVCVPAWHPDDSFETE